MSQFSSDTLSFISGYSSEINNAANLLGIPASAIAGAIAEEYESQLGWDTGPINAGQECGLPPIKWTRPIS